jgi:hypothetical protein
MSSIASGRLLCRAVVFILVATWACGHGYGEEAAGARGGPELAVGQEWSVKSSFPIKVIIGRIEPWRDKVAVHVSVIDIPPSVHVGNLTIGEIAHMPFERVALMRSLDKLLATGVPRSRDFDAGYTEWKERNGGIYAVSLAVAVGVGRDMQW